MQSLEIIGWVVGIVVGLVGLPAAALGSIMAVRAFRKASAKLTKDLAIVADQLAPPSDGEIQSMRQMQVEQTQLMRDMKSKIDPLAAKVDGIDTRLSHVEKEVQEMGGRLDRAGIAK